MKPIRPYGFRNKITLAATGSEGASPRKVSAMADKIREKALSVASALEEVRDEWMNEVVSALSKDEVLGSEVLSGLQRCEDAAHWLESLTEDVANERSDCAGITSAGVAEYILLRAKEFSGPEEKWDKLLLALMFEIYDHPPITIQS